MGEVSAYRFAGSPANARRTMAWYASMFNEGPVLDVGAGRGRFLAMLRARGVEDIGVDISEEAAAEGRRLGVETIVQDAFFFWLSTPTLQGSSFRT